MNPWVHLALARRTRGFIPFGCRTSRASGQRQEQLLQASALGGGILAARLLVEHALAEPAGDDLEAGPVQGPARRGQLGQHVRAVLALLDHPDNAADLALRATQPPDHVRELLAVHVHAGQHIPRRVLLPAGLRASYREGSATRGELPEEGYPRRSR